MTTLPRWDATGWCSINDPEGPTGHHWQPWLQLPGMGLSFDIWFATEAECDDFIREEVIGQGWRQ